LISSVRQENALDARTIQRALAFLGPLSRNPPRAFGGTFRVNRALAPNTREHDNLGDDSGRHGRSPMRARSASRWFESNELTHGLFLRTLFASILAKNTILFGHRDGRAIGAGLRNDRNNVRGHKAFHIRFIRSLARG
jgi:hypothetical protein